MFSNVFAYSSHKESFVLINERDGITDEIALSHQTPGLARPSTLTPLIRQSSYATTLSSFRSL